jgi:hypothetical protein
MKRSFVLFSIFVFLILLLSFVSAGWFSDFLNKITGKPISVEQDKTANEMCSGTALDCASFDNMDSCKAQLGCSWISSNQDITAEVISEFSCTGTPIPCFNFTSASSCMTQEECSWNENISFLCSDSDGGKNYYVKGTAKSNAPEPYEKEATDYCTNDTPIQEDTPLQEAFCYNNGIIGIIEVKCPVNYSCYNGACIKKDYNLSISIFLSKDKFSAEEQIRLI